MRLALFIGRELKRRGQLEDALRQVENELGKVTSQMVDKAVAARTSVGDDGMREDRRNLDRFPEQKDT